MPDPKKVSLSPDAARRVKRATRYVEALRRGDGRQQGAGLRPARLPIRLCLAYLKGAMTDADPTGTVDQVTPLFGISPVDDAAEELEVANVFGWNGDDDALCLIAWDDFNERWIFVQIACPA